MPRSTTTCPSCGAPATGKFCRRCGAGLGPQTCRACQAELRPEARFCDSCGTPVAGGLPVPTDGASRPGNAWLYAGVGALVILALVYVLARGEKKAQVAAVPAGVEAPFAGGAAAGTPPDISNMSPRERFDRLYNRIMSAEQSGDQATLARFTPMALMAYGQLDTVDTEARYHAAILYLHTGQVAAAQALADTIQAQHPGELVGYLIRINAARWARDTAALPGIYRAYLKHYDAEIAAKRPEYQGRTEALADLRREALAAVGSAPAGAASGKPAP